MNILKDFFSGSIITTPFGWDRGPADAANLDPCGNVWPRLHHAIDRFGREVVESPIDAEAVIFLPRDAQGNSVLRLIGDDAEARLYHFRQAEFSDEAAAAIETGGKLAMGAPIAPAGDVGLGFGGAHLHYSIILWPGAYDDFLKEALGDEWDIDRTAAMAAQYGKPFLGQIAQRRVKWMNDAIIARVDPFSGRLGYFVDSWRIFGL